MRVDGMVITQYTHTFLEVTILSTSKLKKVVLKRACKRISETEDRQSLNNIPREK